MPLALFVYAILPVKQLAESMAVTMMPSNFVGVRSLKFSSFRSSDNCSIWVLQRVMFSSGLTIDFQRESCRSPFLDVSILSLHEGQMKVSP